MNLEFWLDHHNINLLPYISIGQDEIAIGWICFNMLIWWYIDERN